MTIQSLVDTAVYESFYLAGIRNDISLQGFKEKAEQIAEIVESVFSSAKETPLTLESKKKITYAVLRTNERTILRLYNYVMKKEGKRSLFDSRTRDKVVKYLERIKVPPVVPGHSSVDEAKIKSLITVFNACTKENNRIDWSIVDRLIFSFDKMQRRAHEINSLSENSSD